MVKTAICDDNEVFLIKFKDILSTMFSKYHIVSDISAYSSGSLLLQHHTQKPFDILFLDIDMPKASSFHQIADSSFLINLWSHFTLPPVGKRLGV